MKGRAHRIGTTLVTLALLGAAAGCGGGDHGGGTRETSTRATTSTARPATTTPAADPAAPAQPGNPGTPADAATRDEVGRLGGRFLSALIRHDPKRLCATLTPTIRRALAAQAGSCEAGADSIVQNTHAADVVGSRVQDIRLLDGYAYAAIERGGAVLTGDDGLVAQRVNGRWLLTRTGGPSRPRLSRADVRKITAVTARYLHALETRRWSVACAARTPEGRSRLARAGGGRCEEAVKAAATGNGLLPSLRAGSVELVDEGWARISIRQGESAGYEQLDVRRVGGRWLLGGADESTYGNTYDLP